jgi:hypothetical protein
MFNDVTTCLMHCLLAKVLLVHWLTYKHVHACLCMLLFKHHISATFKNQTHVHITFLTGNDLRNKILKQWHSHHTPCINSAAIKEFNKIGELATFLMKGGCTYKAPLLLAAFRILLLHMILCIMLVITNHTLLMKSVMSYNSTQ